MNDENILLTEDTELQENIPEENPSGSESEEVLDACEEKQETKDSLIKKLPYHERYYLRYHNGNRCAQMDIDGTRGFLKGIGFDGGELRQAREGKNFAEEFKENENSQKGEMYCSYCGAKITGVEFYRLRDGRTRCTSCSNTLVKTKEEVEQLCKRVINNMDSFFGATIDVPVTIEVMDEIKLKRKIGTPIGTKDDQSILILGVAINKKQKYSIILENGAPRISIIATFAHELTHIWQYTHWDNRPGFKKCPPGNRLLIYEGMAKWAEIQYLYLIGETNIARREEYITRNRNDEYGIGFCIYENRFPLSRETMVCNETPFKPDGYPFD